MKTKIINFVVVVFLFFSAPLMGEWNSYRQLEHILCTGSRFAEFLSTDVNQIFVYSFDSQQKEWQQITFQIDERDGASDYFITPNQVLDSNDEILFMVHDAGDRAEQYQWIGDENSKNYHRYEIEVRDPLDPAVNKYVYLYRSEILTHDTNLPVYLDYRDGSIGRSDSLLAQGYFIGHNEYGIIDRWRIPIESGGSNLDILDRQKARVRGSMYSQSIYATEQKLRVDSYNIKIGPIRAIREVAYKMSIELVGITINVELGVFKYHLYPYKIDGIGTNRVLTADYNITHIRQSFDLNFNAIGMLFNNPENTDITIDGNSDDIDRTIYPSPDVNWYMCSGNPGTFVMIMEFEPPSGSNYRLYYHDNKNGGTDDWTTDTGYDSKSYGDTGVLFTGSEIVGRLSLPFIQYFLPANQPRQAGLDIVENYENPLSTYITGQNFVPVEIAISLPDTSGQQQMAVDIPVRIGDLFEQDITNCDLIIKYDPQILQIDGVSTAGTLVQGWSVPVVEIVGDSISISLQGSNPLENSGTLLYLNSLPIGTAGQVSPLDFSTVTFNGGYPLSATTNGSFLVLDPPQVAVSLPDTSAAASSTITVPVMIGDVTGYNVTSSVVNVEFNKFVLSYNSISTTGTLANDWDVEVTTSTQNVIIEMSGAEALVGSGELIWITFNVIGSSGSISQLHFDEMTFNSGVPVAITSDGSVTVTTPPPVELLVSIPDTSVDSGSTVNIPVRISSLEGVDIYNYQIDLTFAEDVLNYSGVDVAGTITQPWGSPLITHIPNNLTIAAFGTSPLTGSGDLIYLEFFVAGELGSGTTIHFDDMTVSAGSVLLSTHDGTVTVTGVIPVELAAFQGLSDGNYVRLVWTTETEMNNYGFSVEKKVAGESGWNTIGFVDGSGTTTIPQSYEFLDKQVVPGINYYRLKQQDYDGSFKYSYQIEVEVSAPKSHVLHQNYPNPFNSYTNIKYELAEGGQEVNLIIFNLLGQPVRKLINGEVQDAGSYFYQWDGKSNSGEKMVSGIYYLQLLIGDQRLQKKIVFIE